MQTVSVSMRTYSAVVLVLCVVSLVACLPGGGVTQALEPDETPTMQPTATPEIPSLNLVDEDGDTFPNNVDCDDTDFWVNSHAKEVCDGIDNDCDDRVDSADPDVELDTFRPFFIDLDGDGFGSLNLPRRLSCSDPSTSTVQWVLNHSDCDDMDSDVNPESIELMNGVDDNCNGLIDDISERQDY